MKASETPRVSTFRNRVAKSSWPQTPAARETQKAIANPIAAAKAIAKLRADTKLIDFIRLTWPILEPHQPLIVGWAMEAICDHLEAVSKGQIRNLLINVPPGFSKSLCTNVFWPAWEWGPQNRADLRYISWSYGAHLTKRDNERCRDLIQHPLYQALWGKRFKIKADANEKINFKTDKQGFRLASSIGGVGTGERGDRLILDDPHSVEGAESDTERQKTINWFAGTLTSRVRNPGTNPMIYNGLRINPSSTIVIMQRVHLQDVAGVIIDQGLDFEHLLIEMEYEGAKHPCRARVDAGGKPIFKGTSIGWMDPRKNDGDLADPIRYSRVVVDEQKKKMALKQGTNAVAAQFRQWPFHGSGAFFKRNDLKLVDAHTVPPSLLPDIRGWDFAASAASTADKTACVRVRLGNDGKIYVLDAKWIRGEPGAVEDFVRAVTQADGSTVRHSLPQDPGSAGKIALHHLAKHVLQGVSFMSTVEGRMSSMPSNGRLLSKQKRAEPLSSQSTHDNVRIVRGIWNEEFITELCSFPVGQFDDFVDAVVRAYDALVTLPVPSVSFSPTLHTYDS